VKAGNLFRELPDATAAEQFESLLSQRSCRIERIVSAGQTTTPGQWYDQNEDEWVLLLQGEASLQFEADRTELSMQAGDYLLIPAHRRHRVSRASRNPACIWLALFMEADQ